MGAILLILRPEPGAGETAARARIMGLEAVVAPLFEVVPLEWDVPDPAAFDAVMLTSANAARHGGEGLLAFRRHRCFTVGEATAEAARQAGFQYIITGPGDGAALVEILAEAGVNRTLHLGGREHIPLRDERIAIVSRPVYGAEPVEALSPEAQRALLGGAVTLLHSPRAATFFSQLIDVGGLDRSRIIVAAISEAAAAAVGGGWRMIAAAGRPRDEALLELAAKLCKTGAGGAVGSDE